MSMGLPFLFIEPVFLCRYKETDIELVECSFQQACKAVYKEVELSRSADSVTKDFELFCDRSYLIGLSQSIFFFGNTLSVFIFPFLSNSLGRKRAICASLFLGSISMIICGLTRNIYQFMIMLFFSGLSLSGFETISLVYVSEISAERFRNYSTIFLGCSWSIAQIFYGFVTYYVSGWRYQCILLIGVPMFIMFVLAQAYFLETPRYLAAQNKFIEARNALDRICQRNKRPRFEYKLEGEVEKQKMADQNYSSIKNEQTYGYLDLLKYKSLRLMTICLIILWSFRYMIYYGQQYSIGSLGEEINSNISLTALSETVAILLSAPIKVHMNRRTSLFWFSLATTLGSISLIFLSIPETCYLDQYTCAQKVLVVISAVAIRFGVAVFGGVLTTYTSERYPTVVRSQGYGICISSGKIITIFIPMIVIYVENYNLHPLAFFGFLGLGAAIICRFIKETVGQQLQEQIEETQRTVDPLLYQLEEFS